MPWAGAIFAGTLYGAAFLHPALSWLVWFLPVPWLLLVDPSRPRRTALVFHGAMTVAMAIGLHWLIPAGISMWVFAFTVHGAYGVILGWALARCRARWELPFVLLAPLLWTAAEVLRLEFWPHPTTWLDLGTLLVHVPALAQIAEWTGVYGLSALAFLVAGAMADALLAFRGGGFPAALRLRTLGGLAVALLAVAGAAVLGTVRLRGLDLETGPRFAVVQGAVSQKVRNSFGSVPRVFNRHAELSRQADLRGVEMLVWSESTIQEILAGHPEWWDRVRTLARQLDTPILVGAMGIAAYPEGDPAPTNSAYLIRPDGHLAARWDKQSLVPPAETLPGLGRVRVARAAIGGFLQQTFNFYPFMVRGEGTVVEAGRPGGIPIGAMICYDDTVPGPSRRLRDSGAQVLVVLSNEAWFSRGELTQHLDMARLRAIENRRPVVRGTNTGLSAFIDPAGTVREILPRGVPGTLTAETWLTKAEPPPAWVPRSFRWGIFLSGIALTLSTWTAKKRPPKGARRS